MEVKIALRAGLVVLALYIIIITFSVVSKMMASDKQLDPIEQFINNYSFVDDYAEHRGIKRFSFPKGYYAYDVVPVRDGKKTAVELAENFAYDKTKVFYPGDKDLAPGKWKLYHFSAANMNGYDKSCALNAYVREVFKAHNMAEGIEFIGVNIQRQDWLNVVDVPGKAYRIKGLAGTFCSYPFRYLNAYHLTEEEIVKYAEVGIPRMDIPSGRTTTNSHDRFLFMPFRGFCLL